MLNKCKYDRCKQFAGGLIHCHEYPECRNTVEAITPDKWQRRIIRKMLFTLQSDWRNKQVESDGEARIWTDQSEDWFWTGKMDGFYELLKLLGINMEIDEECPVCWGDMLDMENGKWICLDNEKCKNHNKEVKLL